MTPRAIRVLVTRPAAEAQRWAEALCTQGIEAESLPLIDIAPLSDLSDLLRAWRAVPSHAAVMFVSANAVRHFMAVRPSGPSLPALPQIWGTGPGTQAALLDAGWRPGQIRCPAAAVGGFDSEALWTLVGSEVRTWPGRSVLIVRGGNAQGRLAGRDWLGQQLQETGVQVHQCVAYVRRVPVLDAAQQALARRALEDGCWWLFSSSEAAQNLAQILPEAIGAGSRALATHPRIAERLRQQGWGRVEVVPATLTAQIASIECLT